MAKYLKMFHHNKCRFKWHFPLSKIQKILAGARFPHKNNIYGFTSFKWIFKGQKIQIYGDKFFFQNIYLAGSKGFWGTLNCLKSPKETFIRENKKKILTGVRFPLIKITFSGFTSFKCTFKGRQIQIYGDKCLFQKIHFAGSK